MKIALITYFSPPDECKLQQQLASDTPVIRMIANTYPRWPIIPDNFFFRYYQANKRLLLSLPYRSTDPVICLNDLFSFF